LWFKSSYGDGVSAVFSNPRKSPKKGSMSALFRAESLPSSARVAAQEAWEKRTSIAIKATIFMPATF
jgi:hypothetical protein